MGVLAIWRYPVKAMLGELLEAVLWCKCHGGLNPAGKMNSATSSRPSVCSAASLRTARKLRSRSGHRPERRG